LNAIEYPERAHEMLGPLKLGGLDGFPFAGLTGMSARAEPFRKLRAMLWFRFCLFPRWVVKTLVVTR